MHLGRQVLEQKGEGFVNRFGINHMVVVQDEDEIVRDGGDFIEQGCQNRFDWRWLRGLEHSQHPCSNIRLQSSAKPRRGKSESDVGSLSPSSSDSQATGRPQPATHSLTSVVLPKPAGAEMSVSLRPAESPRSAARSGGGAALTHA